MSDREASDRDRHEIEFVYFEGCPHAEQARANLKEVLDSLEESRQWKEWVQGRDATPAWAERLPSPSVLIGGRNVVGPVPDVEGRACAPGGAPSTDQIRRLLTR